MNKPEIKSDETWGFVVVTDQGNGNTYCGKCQGTFNVPFEDHCPKCNKKVVWTDTDCPSFGGSDF